MNSLQASKTFENLKRAFACEAQANQRYLSFAQKAKKEGRKDAASLLTATAKNKTAHASALFAFMVEEPASCTTDKNLKAAIAGEMHAFTDIYPQMARTARAEGFEEIAQMFEALAKADKSHACAFQSELTATR